MDRRPGVGVGAGAGTGRGGGGGGVTVGAGRGGGGWGMEAVQLLDLAEKLLEARDLVGSRKYAERAMESDPLLDGADRVLAAADVLMAAQRRRINNHVDWYAVLQVDSSSSGAGLDLSDVRLHYRRLALLLRPAGHQPFRSSAVEEAFKLVSDAWAVLSDPAKKELYDKELAIAATAQLNPNGDGAGERRCGEDAGAKFSDEDDDEDGGDGSFWTACTNCFYVHEYERGCEDRFLACPNCRNTFLATEMASPPPILPGSDMYYCAWGLFPLGFPGGPNFGWPASASNTANGPEVWRGAAGKQWSQAFFPGSPSWWGVQGAGSMGGWTNTEHGSGNGEPHGGFGSAGKRQKQGDVNVSGSQSFSTANKEKARVATVSERALKKEMRKKVMAKRPKKQVAGGAVGCGVAASGEAEMAASSANIGGADVGQRFAAKPDGGNNAQNVGCSRTVDISAEDLDLNFSIDIDATDNILSSLSTLPFLKDGEIVVVD